MRYFVLFALLLAGCSSSPVAPPPPRIIPPPVPVQRFIQAYEQKNLPKYVGVFTGDFTFEFSTSADSALAYQYETGWFKIDEKESASHLFFGYTPSGGLTLPAASTISLNLAVDKTVDDNTSGVDPATHKVCSARIDGRITVPQSSDSSVTYVISNDYNVFYLVRGDVAANLDTTQPADSTHWYIDHWVNLSEAPSTPSPPNTMTWGALKARYH